MSAEDQDLIDDYLQGKMDKDESNRFCERLKVEKELAEDFTIIKGLYEFLRQREFHRAEIRSRHINLSIDCMGLCKKFLDENWEHSEIKLFWKRLRKDEDLRREFFKHKTHSAFKEKHELLEYMDIAEKTMLNYRKKHPRELMAEE